MPSKCSACKKHTHLVDFKCHICQGVHCIKCRLPEDHNCVGLKEYKNDKTLLKEKLHKAATKDTHNNNDRL